MKRSVCFAALGHTSARAAWTRRGAVRSIYMPELFVDGCVRDWHSGTIVAICRTEAHPVAVTLAIDLEARSAAVFTATDTVRPARPRQPILGVDQHSAVRTVSAVENSSVQLRHVSAVREWIRSAALGGGTGALHQTMRFADDSQINNLRIAAFVHSPQGRALQALPLAACS